MNTFLTREDRSSGYRPALFLAILTLASASTVHAQYTERVLFDPQNPQTLNGITAQGTSVSINATVAAISLNSDGQIAFVAGLVDPGPTAAGNDDTYFGNAVFQSDGHTQDSFNVIYQGTHALNRPCLMTNALIGCVPATVLGNAIINNPGFIAFETYNSHPTTFDPYESVVYGDGSSSPTVLFQNSDNGAGITYSEARLADFNDSSSAYGTMSSGCPSGGSGYLGILGSGGIAGASLNSRTTQTPPGRSTFADPCNSSITDEQLTDITGQPVIDANSFQGHVLGMRQLQSGELESGLYWLLPLQNGSTDAQLQVSFESLPYSIFDGQDYVSNSNGDLAMVVSTFDPGTGTTIRELIHWTAGSNRRTVLTTSDPGWLDITPDSLSMNENGQVIFNAASGPGNGYVVWHYDPASNQITLVGGGQYQSRFIGRHSFNEDGIIVITATTRGQGPSGLPSRSLIVKFSPPTPPVPDISVSRSQVGFGQLIVGTQATESITVSNVGADPLTITQITTPSAPFSIINNLCGQSIAAAASCTFDVQFAPGAVGSFNSAIDILSNDPDEPTVTITLAGSADVPMPDIRVRRNTNFGVIEIGSFLGEEFTITNDGTDPLTISNIIPPAPPFAIHTAQSCNTPVASGGQCSFIGEFRPTAVGDFEATVTIESNDPDESVVDITLSGNGVEPPPPVELSVSDSVDPAGDNSIDFGMLLVRETGQQSFTISNDGQGDVRLGQVGLLSDTANVFSIPMNSDGCSLALLAPASSCTVDVEFSSAAVGSFTAVVDLPIIGGGTLQIDLSGSAALSQFDLAISKASSVTEVSSGSGELIEYTITLTNLGPDTARDIVVTDTLPQYVVLTGTPVCSTGDGCFVDAQGAWTGSWNVGELASPNSATATITLMETIPGGALDTCLVNSVQVVAEAGDTEPANDTASVIVGGGNCADLVLTTAVSGQPMSETMASVTATATVMNDGPQDVAAVVLGGVANFGLGGDVTSVNVTSLVGCSNAPPTAEDATYVCEAGPIAAGTAMDVIIDADITSNDAFTVSYAISVSGSIDPDPSNNDATEVRQVSLQQPPPPVTTSGGGCFIATAAYGSYLDPEVMALRDFRDDWLLTNAPGQAFVEFYYANSPPIADYIAGNEALRTVTRMLLTPLVYGVKYPAAPALMLVGLIVWARRRRTRNVPACTDCLQ